MTYQYSYKQFCTPDSYEKVVGPLEPPRPAAPVHSLSALDTRVTPAFPRQPEARSHKKNMPTVPLLLSSNTTTQMYFYICKIAMNIYVAKISFAELVPLYLPSARKHLYC